MLIGLQDAIFNSVHTMQLKTMATTLIGKQQNSKVTLVNTCNSGDEEVVSGQGGKIKK